jgi:hypothetical protein
MEHTLAMSTHGRDLTGAHSHRRYWTIYRAPRAIRRPLSLLQTFGQACLVVAVLTIGGLGLTYLSLHRDAVVWLCSGAVVLLVAGLFAVMTTVRSSQRSRDDGTQDK